MHKAPLPGSELRGASVCLTCVAATLDVSNNQLVEDFQPLRQPDQVITVWGEVVTLRLKVGAGPEYDRDLTFRFLGGFPYEYEEEFPYGRYNRDRAALEDGIQDAVKRRLGLQFQARVEVRSGSIEILIFIQAIRTVYQTIAQYKDFRESLSLLMSDIRDVVIGVTGNVAPTDQIDVVSALTPGAAVLYAEAVAMFNNGVKQIRTPFIALVISNILLLGIAAAVLILQLV